MPAPLPSDPPEQPHSPPRRILVFGATGSIGRATVRALVAAGHEVVCFVRPRSSGRPLPRSGARGAAAAAAAAAAADTGALVPPGAELREGDVRDPASLARDAFHGEQGRFDAVISCMASRTGTPHDAWAIDHAAHLNVLTAAQAAGVPQMILLSAICVQKPLLAFQHAKLAFEQALMASALTWSIVRPTAFFKSLSGQVARVQRGKPFLLFGDGALTACKPISDSDLAAFLVSCLDDPALQNRILPIGGPGEALTPRQQGELLFALAGKAPRYRQVPVALLDAIIGTLAALGRVVPSLADKAELARIGRYYATESMLLWDAEAGRYDAAATPSTGTETLADHYAKMLRGEVGDDRGEHAVF
jgi:divinyl chlorophyllide a 8-vinyl-reductase